MSDELYTSAQILNRFKALEARLAELEQTVERQTRAIEFIRDLCHMAPETRRKFNKLLDGEKIT